METPDNVNTLGLPAARLRLQVQLPISTFEAVVEGRVQLFRGHAQVSDEAVGPIHWLTGDVQDVDKDSFAPLAHVAGAKHLGGAIAGRGEGPQHLLVDFRRLEGAVKPLPQELQGLLRSPVLGLGFRVAPVGPKRTPYGTRRRQPDLGLVLILAPLLDLAP